MKKTSILVLLMIALGFTAKAQTGTGTYSPTKVFDGMDSIVVHYNPYGIGGNGGDTIFQTFNGPLYAYCYLTDSVPGSGGHVGIYNNGSWAGVVTTIDSLVKVSDSDWVWTMPNVRQFFSVPNDVYVQGVNIIVHTTGGDTQSQNLTYLNVYEFGAPIGDGYPLSTGPVTNVPAGTFLAAGNENIAICYHPQQDTFVYTPATKDGDSIFKANPDTTTLYGWVWAQCSNNIGYDFYTSDWSSVSTTAGTSLTEIDSNNYVYDIHNLVGDAMAAGMPSGVSIDSIGFIARNADGSIQTTNLYIPLVIDTTSTIDTNIGVAQVNANAATVSIYPNPATSAIFVAYSFAQPGNATLTITNMMGQTVMTQDLGNRQVSNMYLSIDNIPSGVYLVTVSNGTSSTVKRLSKQ